MTKLQISYHDLELLSAYLDGQLNPPQQAALEARLQAQPSLSKELAALRNTRQMLRSLPPLRSPHNFTLSPQKYRKQAPTRLPSLFGAVSALSSALLIMLVIGSLLVQRNATPVSLVGEEAYPVALEMSAPEEEATLPLAKIPGETESLDSYPAPAIEETSRIAEPTPELLTLPPAAEESQLVPAPTATPTQQEALTLGSQEVATPTEAPPTEELSSSAAAPTYEVALPGINVAGSGGEATPEDLPVKELEEDSQPTHSPWATTILTWEIILAASALGFGLVALVIFVRERR